MLQVRTKTVQQCVEFFYLNKKLHDKQEKQKQEYHDGGLEQQTGVSTLRFVSLYTVGPPSVITRRKQK